MHEKHFIPPVPLTEIAPAPGEIVMPAGSTVEPGFSKRFEDKDKELTLARLLSKEFDLNVVNGQHVDIDPNEPPVHPLSAAELLPHPDSTDAQMASDKRFVDHLLRAGAPEILRPLAEGDTTIVPPSIASNHGLMRYLRQGAIDRVRFPRTIELTLTPIPGHPLQSGRHRAENS